MKQLLSFNTAAEAHFAAGLLESRGISCQVRDVDTSIAGGLGAGFEFSPTVWIHHDEEYASALEIMNEHRGKGAPDWKCSACGAANEGPFDACWSCGTARA